MKVTKQYENNLVVINVEDKNLHSFFTLENDRQMHRLGECLIDLERTGAREVTIGE